MATSCGNDDDWNKDGRVSSYDIHNTGDPVYDSSFVAAWVTYVGQDSSFDVRWTQAHYDTLSFTYELIIRSYDESEYSSLGFYTDTVAHLTQDSYAFEKGKSYIINVRTYYYCNGEMKRTTAAKYVDAFYSVPDNDNSDQPRL